MKWAQSRWRAKGPWTVCRSRSGNYRYLSKRDRHSSGRQEQIYKLELSWKCVANTRNFAPFVQTSFEKDPVILFKLNMATRVIGVDNTLGVNPLICFQFGGSWENGNKRIQLAFWNLAQNHLSLMQARNPNNTSESIWLQQYTIYDLLSEAMAWADS